MRTQATRCRPCVDQDPLLCDPHAYSSTTSTAAIGGR
jgi:hypothetical protein